MRPVENSPSDEVWEGLLDGLETIMRNQGSPISFGSVCWLRELLSEAETSSFRQSPSIPHEPGYEMPARQREGLKNGLHKREGL
jgi:hypothetical protein